MANHRGLFAGEAGLDDEAAELDFMPGIEPALGVSDAPHPNLIAPYQRSRAAEQLWGFCSSAKGSAGGAPPREALVTGFGDGILEFEQGAGQGIVIGSSKPSFPRAPISARRFSSSSACLRSSRCCSSLSALRRAVIGVSFMIDLCFSIRSRGFRRSILCASQASAPSVVCQALIFSAAKDMASLSSPKPV